MKNATWLTRICSLYAPSPSREGTRRRSTRKQARGFVLGGALAAASSIASCSTDTADIFEPPSAPIGDGEAAQALNIDGTLPTLPNGVAVASSPAVATWAPSSATADDGVIHVFVRGADNIIYTASRYPQRAEPWSVWIPLPGAVAKGNPSAVARTNGTIDVVIRTTTDQIMRQSRTGGWNGWESAGAVTASSDPSVASLTPGSLQVFARSGSSLGTVQWTGAWGGWSAVPNTTGIAQAPSTTTVSAVGRGLVNLDVAYRDSNGQIAVVSYTVGESVGTWSVPVVAFAGSSVGAVLTSRERETLDLFVTRGTTIRHQSWSNGSWSKSTQVSGGGGDP